ncbi:MAG: hypothetical protein M3445_11445 [Actinomycetota bacterium]|nr:hypothetical protein [Actinomycetota bacterium]
MSFRRDNVIKVDVWVDDFVPDVDGHRRVQLWRAVAPAHPTGVVLLKPLADPDGKPAGPYRVDDGWCDHLDE